MPAHPSYNTYNKELTVLRKGHALYHPEPVNGRPVEIGDVGFIVAGSFQFLFSATGGADDPVQVHGVPEGFVPLELSPEALDIRETGIQAGPLHGRTVVSNPTAWDQASARSVFLDL
ncbi:hypothetical protein H0H81_005984 [Sphagnurus paluster]|uniref:Uncharacterized protein n=1 Tax=Sphagnurus paluster TaxID=117069 RepID=A0A9P7KKZ3_9AGAR|nr:hypothetical protein H0H81_005984 [Sphagnurus paluster]